MLRVGVAGSLLVIAKLPLTEPVVVGRNVSFNVTVWPALTVFGVVIPPTANSAPVKVSMEMVRSTPPTFAIVRLSVPWVPILTLPKSTDELLGAICARGLTPVAVRFSTWGVVVASSTTDSVPVTLPVAVGFTETDRLVFCPDGSESGSAMVESVNCGFETLTCVMVTVLLPGLVIETLCVDCFPKPTLPKLTADGLNCKEPGCVFPPGLPSRPAQPFRKKSVARRLTPRLNTWQTPGFFFRDFFPTRSTPPLLIIPITGPPNTSS